MKENYRERHRKGKENKKKGGGDVCSLRFCAPAAVAHGQRGQSHNTPFTHSGVTQTL